MKKPLGRKSYGSIPHLPGSRMGPADHACPDGQERICTKQPRDKNDVIIVTEKLDGSCVAIANVGGRIEALGRAGYRAETSKYEQHHLFSKWVYRNEQRFLNIVPEGFRVVGEWLAQAHGTCYDLPHEPFVAFDLMKDDKRRPWRDLLQVARKGKLVTPALLCVGPISIEDGCELIKDSAHGAIDSVEGFVYRVERNGEFDFIAKWVRHDKEDGLYLPEMSGKEAIWNWHE